MKIYITILNFLFFIKLTTAQIVTSSFHTLFTFIHNDPCILETVFKIKIPSYAKEYCNSLTDSTEMNYIQTMENLDYSAFIHIERIVDEGCPFSHDTCSNFCYLYPTCNFDDRIKHYLDTNIPIKNVGEVLVKDNTLDPLRAIMHFINSPSHGRIILDKSFNYYGMAHYGNVFNINFLESVSTTSEKNKNLETISIYHEEKEYILTTQEICDSSKTLLYKNSNMMIYF